MTTPELADIPGQEQQWPGTVADLKPVPDHGEDSWIGRDRLPGKRVLLTGGDSGIGRAVALAFAKEGATLAIAHLPEEVEDAARTKVLVENAGGTAHLFPGDLRTYEANKRLATDAVGTAARVGDRLGQAAWVAAVAMVASYSMGVNRPRRCCRRRRW